MLSALIDDLLNQPLSPDGLEAYANKIRNKTDIILQAATTAHHNTTFLLAQIKDIPPTACTVGFAILLDLQAEALPETASKAFLNVCSTFFGTASKNHVAFVNVEGEFFTVIIFDIYVV